MSSKDNLKYLFESGQGALKRLLDGVDEEESIDRSVTLCNPVRWQAGHLAWCADIMVGLLGGRRTFPDKWTVLFEYGSRLPEDDTVFPPLEEIRGKLYELHTNMNGLLDVFDESKFADEVELGEDWKMKRIDALLFFARHDYYHAGQIVLARKNLGRS